MSCHFWRGGFGDIMNDEFRLPITEKTDWKEDIRRALVSPSFAYNDIDFMDRVVNCIHIVGCTYPHWDAYREVNTGVDEILKDYRQQFKDWTEKYTPCKRYTRVSAELNFQVKMHYQIWTFLKNYCAKRGLLVDGPRDSKAVQYE